MLLSLNNKIATSLALMCVCGQEVIRVGPRSLSAHTLFSPIHFIYPFLTCLVLLFLLSICSFTVLPLGKTCIILKKALNLALRFPSATCSTCLHLLVWGISGCKIATCSFTTEEMRCLSFYNF